MTDVGEGINNGRRRHPLLNVPEQDETRLGGRGRGDGGDDGGDGDGDCGGDGGDGGAVGGQTEPSPHRYKCSIVSYIINIVHSHQRTSDSMHGRRASTTHLHLGSEPCMRSI